MERGRWAQTAPSEWTAQGLGHRASSTHLRARRGGGDTAGGAADGEATEQEKFREEGQAPRKGGAKVPILLAARPSWAHGCPQHTRPPNQAYTCPALRVAASGLFQTQRATGTAKTDKGSRFHLPLDALRQKQRERSHHWTFKPLKPPSPAAQG